MTFYRYAYCDGEGGLVIADTSEAAVEKLEKKYGKEAVSSTEIWPWEFDDYCDLDNPDVLSIYDN